MSTNGEKPELSMEKLEQILEVGGSMKDAMGLNDKDLEVIYNMGFTEYNQARYEDAAQTFAFLCLCDHQSPRFWMGLGAVWQMMQAFGPATMAYYNATEAGSTDPYAPLHAAECFISLGMLDEAINVLDMAIDWSGNAKNPEEILDRADLMYQSLSQFVEELETAEAVGAEPA